MSEEHADSENCHDDGCDGETPCEQTWCETKRRKLLGAIAAGGSLTLAGCTGLMASPETATIRGRDENYILDFVREDERVDIRGSDTVLRGAERHGLELSHRCRAGFCGECLSRADTDANEAVHMATNNVEWLNEEAIEDGYFLPCTSQPREDFELTSSLGEDGGWRSELSEYQEDDDEDDRDHMFVTYIHDGEPTVVDLEGDVDDLIAEDRSLLATGEEEGLDLFYQCRVGECGQCMAKVSGDASELVELTNNEFDPLDEEAIEEGWTLTCQGFPKESLTIQTNMIEEFQERD